MDRSELRKKLLQYPKINENNIDEYISLYEERDLLKRQLISDGYSNKMAEIVLDKKGYPRPPGWKSVYSYPGGGIRNGFVFLLVLLFLAWLLLA